MDEFGTFLIRPIGKVVSGLKTMEECPLQESENAPEAIIEIFPEFIDGLKDLSAGKEIILLTWFHKSQRDLLLQHRRRDYDAPKVGVFATRSPDRPNPIGMHIVKILETTIDGKIKVDALEALDGTPVIDIKPVLQKF